MGILAGWKANKNIHRVLLVLRRKNNASRGSGKMLTKSGVH
jgi:hypothetical protein